ARIDDAVTKVSDLLPRAAAELVGKWKEAYSRAKAKLQEGAAHRLEEFIVNFDDPDAGLPEKAASRFGWMAKAPAKDLADVLELANMGEKLIEDLYQHADDCVREAAGTGSLAAVHRVGSALKVASRREGVEACV